MKKALFVGCLVFLIAGCGEKPRSTSVSAESPSGGGQLSKESAKTPSAANNKVELINAGSEPKQQLRFAPSANAKQTLQMTMNMNMEMTVAGQTQPATATPPIKTTMEAKVTKVDANGDVHADFSYVDADIVVGANTPPQMVNAMRSQIKKLVGVGGSMIFDNQGNAKQAKLNLSEGLDPNIKQIAEQMVNSSQQVSSPVPAEAVGVGAKWRVPHSVTTNGMALNSTTTYELVGLQNNVATLQMSVEQQAGSQKINPAGLPAGASVDLKSLNSQGKGKITRALNQIMPTSSNISVNSNMEMNVKEAGSQKETPMGMKSAIELTLKSQ
jgi:hypothetical protein